MIAYSILLHGFYVYKLGKLERKLLITAIAWRVFEFVMIVRLFFCAIGARKTNSFIASNIFLSHVFVCLMSKMNC